MIGLGIGLPHVAARRRGFNPASLFGVSDIGWLEPMTIGTNGTLFQDSAGTTPVTAPGQPVGLSLDASGNGNHFVQPTALNRPIYQVDAHGRGYLSHNGTNQWMSTADFAWGSDKATIVAGVRKLSDAAIQILYEFSLRTTSYNGSFNSVPGYSGVGSVTGPYWDVVSKGTLLTSATSPASYPAPQTAVQTILSDIGGDTLTQRINGTQVGQSTADQGTGNFGTYSLYVGARAGTSLFFNGNRYPSMGINRLLTADELAQVEAWVNSKTGAY